MISRIFELKNAIKTMPSANFRVSLSILNSRKDALAGEKGNEIQVNQVMGIEKKR